MVFRDRWIQLGDLCVGCRRRRFAEESGYDESRDKRDFTIATRSC